MHVMIDVYSFLNILTIQQRLEKNHAGLRKLPVLYLSRFIIQNKAEYYAQLQQVRETNNWEPWLLFMLEGISQTAQDTIALICGIKTIMMQYKKHIRDSLPKVYSQDLLNNLFKYPYTKIDYVMEDLNVSRITATKYLDLLVDNQLLHKQKLGRGNYYINQPLTSLLMSHRLR